MVAKPIVQYLLKENFHVTVATRTRSKADKMIKGFSNGKAIAWTVDDDETLDRLIAEHDCAVSLLPYAHHLNVAKKCIRHGKEMVTTSYVKPEMKALHDEAKTAGIIILNEIGLDPGIDHMSAMRIIDYIHDKGGNVEEFYSLCGALPSLETADNPFMYKFSWSPKGVIMASNNDGRYMKHGKETYVSSENLFKDTFMVDFPDVGKLEVYPNRNSIDYIDIYKIHEAKTMFRGTFRHKGWCETLDAMKRMNLISYDKVNLEGKTYGEMTAMLIGEDGADDLKQKAAGFLGIDINAHALKAMEWLGLFNDKTIGRTEDSPFEVVSDLMLEKMSLGENERDMVVLMHLFLASYPDGKKEVIKSRLLDYGSPKTDTSVARTVALPAAIAVKMILNGRINVKGVYRPVLSEIYNSVLDELEKTGIKMVEEYDLPESEMINL